MKTQIDLKLTDFKLKLSYIREALHIASGLCDYISQARGTVSESELKREFEKAAKYIDTAKKALEEITKEISN
jgi:hypothetical protein